MSERPYPEHDPQSIPSSSAAGAGISQVTTSELSLSRALNSLLPPSLKAAEIHSFKPKPEKSLQLFDVTHLPPRETIRALATRLNTCLGITFFIVESPAEVENLVDRVYFRCNYYNSARQEQEVNDAAGRGVHGMGNGLSARTMRRGQSPQPPTTSEICEILAMAAVGSQYDRQASASLRQACFQSACAGLDDAIEEEGEMDAGDETCYRVLRLLTLLSIYQILEKRGSCWRYIGTFSSLLPEELSC